MVNRRYIWVVCAFAFMYAAPTVRAGDEYEWRGGQWVPVAAPAKGTPVGELEQIRKLLELGKPNQALAAADKFLGKHPNNEGCAEVTFLAGQAEMDRGRYYQAFERFEKHLQQYPGGPFFEGAVNREFEIAEAFLAGRKRVIGGVLQLPAETEGLEILLRIAEHSPRTPMAGKALLRIADHHFAKKEYTEAAAAYDSYLEQFDRSKLAPQAMLKAAQAAYGAFGAACDETPLLEAEQRFKLLAERYPAEAANARVQDTLRHITNLRAQNVCETAKFYERVGRQAAAVFYYRRVTAEYPQTMWATDARAALIRLGKPEPSREPAQTDPAAKPGVSVAGESKGPAAASTKESGSEK